MNICCFIGRLTATPELKATQNGKSVCSFSLAVERRFKGADGKPVVDFVEFVAWEHNAEFLCKWFDKGVKVAVTGELQTRTFTDKDGNNRKVTEVLVNTIEFADGKAVANANVATVTTVAAPSQEQNDDEFIPVDDSESDLPF